jgi:hypothetical protein
MARERDRDSEKGVSLRSKDAIDSGGLFGPGRAKLKRLRFEMFEYKPKAGSKKKSVRAPVLLATYSRDGETEKVPYGVGSGWGIAKGGLALSPRNNQEGLPKNCNALYFIQSCEEAGMPDDFLDTPDKLDGVELILVKKPIARDFGDKGQQTSNLLIVDEFTKAPWLKGKKKPAKPADDEDEDEDDDNEDEANGDDDDDDDDDENDSDAQETRSGKKKPKKPVKDEDADEDEDDNDDGDSGGTDSGDEDDVDEEAGEALIELLATGPLKQADVEKKLKIALKGNKQKNVIAARASEDEFLEKELGWSYNAKTGRVKLD